MKQSIQKTAAFSLVEVVLAIGVAAFALIAILGMFPVAVKTQQAGVEQTKANAIISYIIDELRADVRLPKGLASQAQGDWSILHGHWAAVAQPDTMFFTNDLQLISVVHGSGPPAPAGAVFRATLYYMKPPTLTTSIAQITVSWPATQSDLTQVAGSIDMFAAVNR
jgi:type II secretory pathway pseudopilin PulG